MKERPIIFSTPMVKAILEGRKTMTRRIIKNIKGATEKYPKGFAKCPYGVVGDRLWVKETYFPNEGQVPNIIYKADWNDRHKTGITFTCQWKPSIFMPRIYSRITLETTNIRVERLQEITEEDAKKEGVMEGEDTGYYNEGFYRIWDKINGKDSWKENPYVWVIEFRRII